MPKKRCSEKGGLMHRLSRRKLLQLEPIPETRTDLSEVNSESVDKLRMSLELSSGQTNEKKQSDGWNFT